MAQERVDMRNVREILRLYFGTPPVSKSKIAGSLGVSRTCIQHCLRRFKDTGLPWPLPPDLSDSALEEQMYRNRRTESSALAAAIPLPDFESLLRELHRPHVTAELLWQEYRESHPDGISRSAFYRRLGMVKSLREPTMRMVHKGGDKVFIDYSGDGPEYIDRETGLVHEVAFFVCCWGASNFGYAEATESQKAEDWICSHVRAHAYFGCVPNAWVPDNTKTAVLKAHRYDPVLNPLYTKLAQHYDVAVLPARPVKPRDKAKVENAVRCLQRYILGRLRNRRFFSLHEVNVAIRELLERFNDHQMKQYKRSRRQLFEELDRPNARALPATVFQICKCKQAIVAPDYHIDFDGHLYSVPYTLEGQTVMVYQDGNTVEIYHDGLHIYRHLKYSHGGHTTVDEHMPPNHRYVKGWSPQRFIERAEVVGPCTAEVVKQLMQQRRHPEQGYRAVQGVLAVQRSGVPAARLELACRRALHFKAVSYQAIISILEKRLDEQPLPSPVPQQTVLPILHEHIRGPQCFAEPQPNHVI